MAGSLIGRPISSSRASVTVHDVYA